MSKLSTYLGATAAALGALAHTVSAQQGTRNDDDDDDDSWRWGGGGNTNAGTTNSEASTSSGSSKGLSETQELVLVIVGGGALVVLIALAVFVVTGRKRDAFVLPIDGIKQKQKKRKWSTWLPVGECSGVVCTCVTAEEKKKVARESYDLSCFPLPLPYSHRLSQTVPPAPLSASLSRSLGTCLGRAHAASLGLWAQSARQAQSKRVVRFVLLQQLFCVPFLTVGTHTHTHNKSYAPL
jgi:hypothetical protein